MADSAPEPKHKLFPKVVFGLEQPVVDFFDQAGLMFITTFQALRYIVKLDIDVKKTITQVASIGFDSMGMSILICMIAGAVLSLQTAAKFAQTGADSYVGGLVALAIVREIGPIFTCLAVGARAGTAIAAEIANMQVTDQVDALQVMRVDPIRYLVVPRLLACMLALPMLTVIGETVAILGGMLVAQSVAHLHYHMYLESVWLWLKPYDIRVGILKALVFGLILGAISCNVGLRTRGGARDVGLSTTKAVVWISIVLIVTDFILTWIFFGTSYNG